MLVTRLHHYFARNILRPHFGNNTFIRCQDVVSWPYQSASLIRPRVIPTLPTIRPYSEVCQDSQAPSPRTGVNATGLHSKGIDFTQSSFRPSYSNPHQCGTWTWSSLIALGLAGCTLILSHFSHSERPRDLTQDLAAEEKSPGAFNTTAEDWLTMTAEMLPGRPGTLTVEQEAKLRELWRATLHVFGVLEKGQSSRTSTDLLNGSAASLEAGSGEKHKKKRLGLFGRKKNSDTDSGPSTESSAGAPAGAEDKYGQTKQFHEALANQSPEVLRTTFWSMVKHDHPDALLLRFLRARKWDVEKALIMMVSTMNWRATEMHVDDEIIKSGEMGSIERSRSLNHVEVKLGEDFMAQIRMGKSFLHGVDKMGRPICIVRVRLHKQGEQSEESLERYTVFVIETARMILNPPIDTACVIFDMTGFSMANMDYTPVKFMIKCFEANYPESLGVVLVHKAPWIFQGIWKIIKGWLDPVVASKVHFTNSAADMEDFVTKDHILKELGGEEDWSYQYIEPLAGENDKMMDTEAKERFEVKRQKIVKTYEQDTLEWIETGTGPNAVEFMRKRNLAAAQLRVNYWELDPYIRARSIYDRSGMLQPGGRVQFYQGRETLSSAPVVNGAPVETSSADLD